MQNFSWQNQYNQIPEKSVLIIGTGTEIWKVIQK